MPFNNFVGQPLRFQSDNPLPSRQQMSLEIGSGTHEKLEIGVFVGAVDFALAMVQRQVAQVVDFRSVGSQNNLLGLRSVAHNDAETLAKIIGSVEIVGDFELLVQKFHILHSVERKNRHPAIVELPQQILPPVKQLDAIGRERKRIACRGTVAAIAQSDTAALLHRRDNLLQFFIARGNVFQQNAVVQALAFAQQIADAERREHPVLYGVFAQHMGVADVIFVPVFAVALDVDAENVLDGVLVPVESRATEGQTSAHLRLHPFLIDFCKRDSFGATDCVHQPNVFLEQKRGCHKRFLVKRSLDAIYDVDAFLRDAAEAAAMQVVDAVLG